MPVLNVVLPFAYGRTRLGVRFHKLLQDCCALGLHF